MMIASLALALSFVLPGNELDDLPLLTGGIKRVSSYDRKEGNNDFFNVFPGQSLVLADLKEPGTIKRIFIKVDSDDPNHLRTLLLRAFWDDSREPSIDAPLGDFFALGHGKYYPVKSVPIVTGNRRGMTCYWPMPFHKRALMLLVNEGVGLVYRVHYQIDYLPEAPAEESGYFHALYSQRVMSAGEANFMALHTEGKGKYVGLVLSIVLGEDGWFGEGDERIYVDGVEVPYVQGTGLDDFFGCAWGFQKGFSGPYIGTPVAGDLKRGAEFTGYRFLLRDPITFEKSIDVYLEHVGERYSAGLLVGEAMSRRDEYYSVAYWYQEKAGRTFSRMPMSSERVSGDKIYMVEAEFLRPLISCADRMKIVNVDSATMVRFTPKAVGDAAVFNFSIAVSGWYRISGIFARSSRHGTYRCAVNDETLHESLDFYKGEGGTGREYLQRSDEIQLGRIYLGGGEHTLRFEATGSNDDSDGMVLHVDALLIRPAPQQGE